MHLKAGLIRGVTLVGGWGGGGDKRDDLWGTTVLQSDNNFFLKSFSVIDNDEINKYSFLVVNPGVVLIEKLILID